MRRLNKAVSPLAAERGAISCSVVLLMAAVAGIALAVLTPLRFGLIGKIHEIVDAIRSAGAQGQFN